MYTGVRLTELLVGKARESVLYHHASSLGTSAWACRAAQRATSPARFAYEPRARRVQGAWHEEAARERDRPERGPRHAGLGWPQLPQSSRRSQGAQLQMARSRLGQNGS